jgi:hypothetical protein
MNRPTRFRTVLLLLVLPVLGRARREKFGLSTTTVPWLRMQCRRGRMGVWGDGCEVLTVYRRPLGLRNQKIVLTFAIIDTYSRV